MIYSNGTVFYVRYTSWWNDLEKGLKLYKDLKKIYVKGKVLSTDLSSHKVSICFPALLEVHTVSQNYFKNAKARSDLPKNKIELTLHMFVAAEGSLAVTRMTKQFSALCDLKSTGVVYDEPRINNAPSRTFEPITWRKMRTSSKGRRKLPTALRTPFDDENKECLRLEINASLSVFSPIHDGLVDFQILLAKIARSIFRSLVKKKNVPECMVIVKGKTELVVKVLIPFLRIFGWDITELPKKSHFVAQTESIDTVASSIGNKDHMFHRLNPLERIYFTNDSDVFERMKSIVGISGDILCNPMDFTIGMTDFTRKAHVELGEAFPTHESWHKAKMRDAIVELRQRTNFVGMKQKLSVVVSPTAKFQIQIKPSPFEGSFFILHFSVEKHSFKFKDDGVTCRRVF